MADLEETKRKYCGKPFTPEQFERLRRNKRKRKEQKRLENIVEIKPSKKGVSYQRKAAAVAILGFPLIAGGLYLGLDYLMEPDVSRSYAKKLSLIIGLGGMGIFGLILGEAQRDSRRRIVIDKESKTIIIYDKSQKETDYDAINVNVSQERLHKWMGIGHIVINYRPVKESNFETIKTFQENPYGLRDRIIE